MFEHLLKDHSSLDRILETLETEYGVVIDNRSEEFLSELKADAEKAGAHIKQTAAYNTYHLEPTFIKSILICEAIKLILQKETFNPAKITKESNMSRTNLIAKAIRESNELGKAEILIAAKGLADALQKDIEDLTKKQTEDLNAITDEIRKEFDQETATSFSASIDGVMSQAIENLKLAKETIDSETMRLSGDEVAEPFAEPANDEMSMDMDDEMPMDTEEEPNDEVPLGHKKKEFGESIKMVVETHSGRKDIRTFENQKLALMWLKKNYSRIKACKTAK